MELRIQDVAELLQVSERVINQWIKEKKIPAYKMGYQYRFNKAELNDWIVKNDICVSGKILNLSLSRKPTGIADLIVRGGIHYGIEGKKIQDVIGNAVNRIDIPDYLDTESLIGALLQRETLMPTAIGNGIAIPHSRNPILSHIEDEQIPLCFLKQKLAYKALDGEPLHSLFIILSATPQRHLEILSKLSYLCRQPEFVDLLRANRDREAVIGFIENQESEWKKTENGNAE